MWLFKIIKLWFKSYRDDEFIRLIQSMREQEAKGWVFKISGRGACSRYYDPDKDTTPNKDGWDIGKQFREHQRGRINDPKVGD